MKAYVTSVLVEPYEGPVLMAFKNPPTKAEVEEQLRKHPLFTQEFWIDPPDFIYEVRELTPSDLIKNKGKKG